MAAMQAVKAATSREGKNQYTQSWKRELVFDGWSDCSSLMWKSYEKAYGLYIGSWTGEQVCYGWQVGFYGGKDHLTSEDLKHLEPGDLIFFGSGDAKHVEMYVGNGRLFGHGSGTPSYKNALTYTHSAGVYQARRYWTDDKNEDIDYEEKEEEQDGWDVDDIVPLTRIDMPVLKKGDKGKYVYFLQAAINLFNYGLDLTGKMDKETVSALKTFQKVHKLESDGEAGEQTWREIFTTVTV